MKKLALIIIVSICIVFTSFSIVRHGLFISEMNTVLVKDMPADIAKECNISINPITNTITLTILPDGYKNNPLGAAVIVAMAPLMERQLEKKVTKKAKEYLDFYVYLVPFSFEIDVNIIEMLTE